MKSSAITAIVWSLLTIHTGYTLAGDVLKNNGFTTCLDNSDIKVERLNFQIDRASKTATYDLAGSNSKVQNVTATITINAYGQVFTQHFDPCDATTFVEQLCPVPAGRFSAKGQQPLSDGFASKIPSIAFAVPDLEAQATVKLNSKASGSEISCVQSIVGNGNTFNTPTVSYVAVGISGAALVVSGASAAIGAAQPGAPGSSPSFGQIIGVFQAISMNGMLSVDYPAVYSSFTKNFGFSMGLIPWTQMQISIDNFRNVTGGNLTENSVEFLHQSSQMSQNSSNSTTGKRSLDFVARSVPLFSRDIQQTANNTVSGMKKAIEDLSIPAANTFMTVLLIFAIVIAAIAAGILLVKVILEAWAVWFQFPKRLSGFRKHYWGFLGRTITSLILVLYGVWTLYCIFQFTRGDSWAAKLLAGVTLAIFTAVLGYFSFCIWALARRLRKSEGTASALFEDKEAWRRYSLFYDHYKKDYWWIFVPVIVYLFARGCIIAGADGHGLVQSAGQFVVEALMLGLLLWTRPFETRSGQWINISIQVVRVLSVGCIIVFVERFGISKTTKTITGVALIAVQTTLAVILGILIVINGIITLFGKNPHQQRRKAKKHLSQDIDTLTPLDPHHSILLKSKTNYARDEESGSLGYVPRYEPYHDAPHRPKHIHRESTTPLTQHRLSSPERPRSPGSDTSLHEYPPQQQRASLLR